MKISLNIILERLSQSQYYFEGIVKNREKLSFSRVLLLPSSGTLNPDYLYICRLSELVKRWDIPGNIVCISLRNRLKDEKETETFLKHVIIVNVNIDFHFFFDEIQDIVYSISDWIASMQECIIRSKTMQDVLDVSEKMIGNFIAISDASLTLLAHTKNIPCDDAIATELVRHGYHPDTTVQHFKKHRRFDVWSAERDIIVNTDSTLSRYAFVSKVYKFRNIYFTHVVMTCNNRPLSPGLLDLFRILLDNLAIYVELDWKRIDSQHRIYDSFLSDLIENQNLRYDVVLDRAKYLGISCEGCFEVFAINIDKSNNLPVGRLVQELSDVHLNNKAIYYQNEIVMLHPIGANKSSDNTEKIQAIMQKYHIYCGVSARFMKLTDMAIAYKQAKIAASFYGEDVHLPFNENNSDNRCVFYENYYHHYLLCIDEKHFSLVAQCDSYRALNFLRDHDEKHKSNYNEILFHYLICERRAKEAAKVMHMHRNNVIYHIEKIKTLIGLDLNDSKIRIQLLLSYLVNVNKVNKNLKND